MHTSRGKEKAVNNKRTADEYLTDHRLCRALAFSHYFFLEVPCVDCSTRENQRLSDFYLMFIPRLSCLQCAWLCRQLLQARLHIKIVSCQYWIQICFLILGDLSQIEKKCIVTLDAPNYIGFKTSQMNYRNGSSCIISTSE